MILCPRCEYNGVVAKYLVKGPDIRVHCCDECDLMWNEGEDLKKISFRYVDAFLEENGLEIARSNFDLVDDYWVIWFDRITQKFAGKQKLESALYPFLGQVFNQPPDRPMIYVYTLTPKHIRILGKFIEGPIDFSKYAYFMEIDEGIGGKITAESHNYIRLFSEAIEIVEAMDKEEYV